MFAKTVNGQLVLKIVSASEARFYFFRSMPIVALKKICFVHNSRIPSFGRVSELRACYPT